MLFKPELVVAGVLSLASVWCGGLVYQNHWAEPVSSPRIVSTAPERVSASTPTGEARQLDIENLKRPTLLLVLSADCRYCEQNAPEWRGLVAALGSIDSPPEVIALSLSDAEDTAVYLEESELEVPALLIDRTGLAALGLPGVPGTIALDPGSASMRSWVGVLSETEVEAILTWAMAN
jgi:hypothetical protein